MATYKLTGKYESLLSTLSNDLSVELGKKISKSKVLELILDVVLEEDKLFSVKDEQIVSAFRRIIYKTPSIKEGATTQELLHKIKLITKTDSF